MHIEQGTSHMEVLSAIRGRLRLQFETAVASDEPFRRVPGVLSCRYNPRIRTLLCEYDPDAISEEKLIVRLGAAYAAHINELLRSLNVNGEEEAQPADTEQTED